MSDHDDQTIGRIFSRREALRLAGGAAAALATARAAFGEPTTRPREPLVASPAMTEGPFFSDRNLNRRDLVAGADREAVTDGAPLALTMAVYRLTGGEYAPMPGVRVDLWQCDAVGVYSDFDHRMNHERTAGQTWLRGYQLTGDDGLVTFDTIVPGWYRGRTPHVHFKVRPPAQGGGPQKEFTSQLFFNIDELRPIYARPPYDAHGLPDRANEQDGIYSQRLPDGSRGGDQMLLDLAETNDGRGYYTELPLLLADDTLQGRRRPAHRHSVD